MTRTELATVHDISDAALMRRLAGGDTRALGPLHQRYGRMVGSLLLRVVPDMTPEQADELSQEVFITLAETAKRYREQDRLRSWICGIAVRHARGWNRRTWFRRNLLRQHPGEGTGTATATRGDALDRLAAGELVQRAMTQLGARQREVLVLHVVEGLTGEEIAGILGIRVGTVWVRLHRARAAFRDAVERLEATQEEGS